MMRIRWPQCRIHDRSIEHHPDIEVGSEWKCPECSGAVDTDEEQQE